MKIFPEKKDESLIIGRLSPIEVEIDDPVTDYYYFGRVEMFDTEVHFEDEEKPRKIFFYRTLTKYREDEKIIVATDDFIANANNIPYTRSRKGKTTLLMIVFLTYLAIEMLTIYLAYLFVQAGPNIVYYPQVVNSLIWNFGTIAFLLAAAAGIWAWSARYHHFVLDWQIQPYLPDANDTKVDLYILTNSQKLPVAESVVKLAKLSTEDVNRLREQIRTFDIEKYRSLKAQKEGLLKMVDRMDTESVATILEANEIAFATRKERYIEKLDSVKYVLITIVAIIAVMFMTYLASGGRL